MTQTVVLPPIPAALPMPDVFAAPAMMELWLQGASSYLHAVEIGAQALTAAADAYRGAAVAIAGGVMSAYPAALAECLALGPEICLRAAASPLQSAGFTAPLLNDA